MTKSNAKLATRHIDGNPVENRILRSIPGGEFRKLSSALEFVILPHHCSLHDPSKDVTEAYFINTGLASLIVPTCRKSVEIGVVGCEGLTGVTLAAGMHRTTALALVQIAGNGFKIERRAFEKIVRSAPQLRHHIFKFSIIQAMQVAQTAACNRLHNASQRLARWLLTTRDRVSSDIIRLTHDFLSTMLGTDRPTVSIAAGALQKLGAIEYRRRSLTILNRKTLERAACECYFVVRQFNPTVGL